MIEFSRLEITSDNSAVKLSANVINEIYYTKVYIKSVKVDTQNTFIEGGIPSTHAITLASYQEEDYVKSVDLVITSADLNGIDPASNFLIFYIEACGTPTADVPCGRDNIYTIGVTYNFSAIYTQGMNLLKNMSGCEVSPELLDFMMKKEGIGYALNTGNLPEAVAYWKSFFSKVKTPTITNRCCCHG